MMNHIKLLYIYVVCCFIAIPSLAQNNTAKEERNSEKFDYYFQEAVRQKLAQNYCGAFDLYCHCLKLNPQSGATLYELADLYRYLHSDSLSIEYMEKACKLYPDNYWYNDRLVLLYYNNRRADDAQRVLEEMAVKFPDKSDVLMNLLDVYSKNEDYENVIKVLEKIEIKEGKSEQISMEKLRIYMQMNDEKRAFREIQELAKEYPNDLRYQVMIGDHYIDTDKPKEAMKVFREIEQKDSLNVNLQLSMSSYYQKFGTDSLYQQQINKIVVHPNLDTSTRLKLVGSLMYENLSQGEDSMRMLRIFDSVEKVEPESSTLLEMRARYMVTKQMPADDVKPYLYKILDREPESDLARNQLLAYAIASKDTNAVVSVCKPAVEYNASDPVYYYYLGVAYFQQEKKEEAVEVFRKALAKSNYAENKDIVTNSYSLLGDLYHMLGDDDKCFQAYDSCLIYKQNDAVVLNNYAYYLSLCNKHLDKAEEMSRKSNELEPDNATYLDTYAWVLYQLKRYPEAKDKIDRTIELMGDEIEDGDGNIFEHAGDIYYRCGDAEGALRLWQKAQQYGGSDDEKALMQKIKKKRL